MAQSVDRVLRILEELVQEPEGLTVSELHRRAKIPISSTHDLVRSLRETGALAETPGGRYILGPRAIAFGLRATGSLPLSAIGRSELSIVAQETTEDVYWATRIGGDIFYTLRVPGRQAIVVTNHLGNPRALHSTAVGKLFASLQPDLAESVYLARNLERFTPHTIVDAGRLRSEFGTIARRRFSYSRAESILGVWGLAVPVAAHDEIVAAIHVSLPETRATHDHVVDVCTSMIRSANRASGRLGSERRVDLAVATEIATEITA